MVFEKVDHPSSRLNIDLKLFISSKICISVVAGQPEKHAAMLTGLCLVANERTSVDGD